MNKKIVRLTESDLHRVIKESVKRVLKENQYDLTVEELIEKYYKNFEEAYKLLDKANKLLNGSINVREIESINSKIDDGKVDNDVEYCLPEAVSSVSDARSHVGSVLGAMNNYTSVIMKSQKIGMNVMNMVILMNIKPLDTISIHSM